MRKQKLKLRQLIDMATSFDIGYGLEINKVIFQKKPYYIIQTHKGEYITKTLDCVFFEKITDSNINTTHFPCLRCAVQLVEEYVKSELGIE